MAHNSSRSQLRRRGGILLTTLIFSVIIATMLGGLGTLVISYYSRASTESMYANAINVADAGINYELRRINVSVANADMAATSTAVTFGSGKFTPYCTMADGVTNWDESTIPFYIFSTGAVGATSRMVKIKATGTAGGTGFAGLFAVVSGTSSGSPTINGSLATDGTLTASGALTVTGSVIFEGAGAGWSGSPPGSYSTIHNANSVAWPTSSAVALSQFPNSGATAPGGYSYLAVHNDNATASPAIAGNSVVMSGSSTCTLVGKAGGANYYLTSVVMSGTSHFLFDNTLGPINIWVPSSAGGFTLSGGSATVKMGTDPTKAVKAYIATNAGVTLSGVSEVDAGVYCVTGGSGAVTMSGSTSFNNTSVICDRLTMSGSPTITTPSGYFSQPGNSTYSFAGNWTELNGM